MIARILTFAALIAVAASYPGQGGVPGVNLAFAATQTLNCSTGWPDCASTTPGGSSVYTIGVTLDLDQRRSKTGPISLLPAHENQIVIDRYDTGYKYGLFVDVSVVPPRVINCTRQVYPTVENFTAGELREAFLGYIDKSQPSSPAPCDSVGRLGTCDTWLWTSQVGCSGPGIPPGTVGLEPETWFTKAPASGGNLTFAGMSNLIHTPKVCCQTERCRPPVIWAIEDMTLDWTPNPPASAFNVPPASQCKTVPLEKGRRMSLLDSVHPSLRAGAARLGRPPLYEAVLARRGQLPGE